MQNPFLAHRARGIKRWAGSGPWATICRPQPWSQTTSRRALGLHEANSKVLNWEVWTDTQIQKFPAVCICLSLSLRSSSPNLQILINSFKSLHQPLQVGENTLILEMGKPRHRTKPLSEELRTLSRMGVGLRASPAARSRWESMVLFE